MWNTTRAAPHRFQTVTLASFVGRRRALSLNSATVCNYYSFIADLDADVNASPLILKGPTTRPSTTDRPRRPAPWRPWPVLANTCTASIKIVLWRCARWHECECRIRRGRCKRGPSDRVRRAALGVGARQRWLSRRARSSKGHFSQAEYAGSIPVIGSTSPQVRDFSRPEKR